MDEFWKAVAEADWTPPAPPEFRLYYNPDTGAIIEYTTEHRPGEFILVDKDIFSQNRFEPLIRDGKMIWPKPPVTKLVPSIVGTACDPLDITITSQASEVQHWGLKIYES